MDGWIFWSPDESRGDIDLAFARTPDIIISVFLINKKAPMYIGA